MNEQELLMKQKIEKREKTDKILAYILIVVLLACILIVLYLKFIKKEDVVSNTNPEEHTANYITLEKLSESLNKGELISKYNVDDAAFFSTVNNSTLKYTYKKDEKEINIEMPLINNELEITIEDENKDIITSIYKEITAEVCNFYNNDMSNCRNKVNSITKDTDGIRFLDNKVYINIMKSIEKDSNDEKILKIGETTEELNFDNINIKEIKTTNTNEKFIVSGTITSTIENNVLNLIIKLYNESGELLSERKKEYTAEAPLNSEDKFEVSFDINKEFPLDVIKKYSITIER